jgi:hypothetical protein
MTETAVDLQQLAKEHLAFGSRAEEEKRQTYAGRFGPRMGMGCPTGNSPWRRLSPSM